MKLHAVHIPFVRLLDISSFLCVFLCGLFVVCSLYMLQILSDRCVYLCVMVEWMDVRILSTKMVPWAMSKNMNKDKVNMLLNLMLMLPWSKNNKDNNCCPLSWSIFSSQCFSVGWGKESVSGIWRTVCKNTVDDSYRFRFGVFHQQTNKKPYHESIINDNEDDNDLYIHKDNQALTTNPF